MTGEREVLAEVAAVLGEHAGCVANDSRSREWIDGSGMTGFDVWSCGIEVPFVDDLDEMERAHLAHALADLLDARDRRVRAETLREAAEAIDSGDADPEELRLAGVNEVAPRGWSDGSVISAYDSSSVWRDWLRLRADRIEAEG